MDADAGIVAVVDAAEDEVGTTWNDLLQGQLHTIHGRAAAGTQTYGRREARSRNIRNSSADTNRCGAGDGGGSAGACAVRSDDIDIAQRGHSARQSLYACGLIAVVVSDEDERRFQLKIEN